MTAFNRRTAISRMLIATSGSLGGILAASAQAQPGAGAPVLLSADAFRIVIPANPGGGWDQTGRALGAALIASGSAKQVEYENIGGKGGTIGLAKYVEKYHADPNALLIGGTVMVGAVALQKPATDLTTIRPLARLTSDYLVAVVAQDSPIQATKDLADAMRSNLQSVPIAGGSAGGVDHMFAGILARAFKARPEHLVYKPFASGAEVVNAVASGNAVVGLSGYSEFSDAIAAGKIRPIAVSSRSAMFGLPSFRQQGVDAVMANWRGVFTGHEVPGARRAQLLASIEAAAKHDAWTAVLKKNRWEAAWMAGRDFDEFIELDLTTARVMVYLLKLKA